VLFIDNFKNLKNSLKLQAMQELEGEFMDLLQSL